MFFHLNTLFTIYYDHSSVLLVDYHRVNQEENNDAENYSLQSNFFSSHGQTCVSCASAWEKITFLDPFPLCFLHSMSYFT